MEGNNNLKFLRIFASNLKNLMEEMKINRSQLAREIGVSDSAVSKWLLMQREPTLLNIIKITKILGCTFEELIGE